MPGAVICGVSDSGGRAVVKVAAHPGDCLGSSLLLVHVIGLTQAARGTGRRPAAAQAELLLSALAFEEELPNTTERAVRAGRPAAELALVADLTGADLIVVGASRRRHLLPTRRITDELIERAGCPVVVVPRTAAAAAHHFTARTTQMLERAPIDAEADGYR